VTRALRLVSAQLVAGLALRAEYRFQLVLEGLLTLATTAVGLVPLYVALAERALPGGWTFARALAVVGCFTALRGVQDGLVSPSLLSLVEHVRKGTLDFVLTKPADAQLLVSTSRVEPFHALDVLAGLGLVAASCALAGHAPGPAELAAFAAFLLAGAALLYSTWLVVVTSAFWLVRVDNLAYLLHALFDFARWPKTVFRGALGVLFTLVLPLGLMTTTPALALFGLLDLAGAATALGLAALFVVGSRLVFRAGLGAYTSASS
jgi:ABC-2 type transport system permease protein